MRRCTQGDVTLDGCPAGASGFVNRPNTTWVESKELISHRSTGSLVLLVKIFSPTNLFLSHSYLLEDKGFSRRTRRKSGSFVGSVSLTPGNGEVPQASGSSGRGDLPDDFTSTGIPEGVWVKVVEIEPRSYQ